MSQIGNWNRRLGSNTECKHDIPPPKGHGWKVAGESHEMEWMTLPSAPEAIEDHVHCL